MGTWRQEYGGMTSSLSFLSWTTATMCPSQSGMKRLVTSTVVSTLSDTCALSVWHKSCLGGLECMIWMSRCLAVIQHCMTGCCEAMHERLPYTTCANLFCTLHGHKEGIISSLPSWKQFAGSAAGRACSSSPCLLEELACLVTCCSGSSFQAHVSCGNSLALLASLALNANCKAACMQMIVAHCKRK